MPQATESDQIIFEPNSVKQEDAIFSEDLLTILGCGTQFGKTLAGAMWMKRYLHSQTDRDSNFLITAPTYKVLKQSTLRHFMKVMNGYGKYHETEATFTMHNGGTVYFRTATDPDSVVGITDVKAIWGDEAGLYSLYFWENIQARQAVKNCPVILTTSPYTLNWIYKDYIKKIQKAPIPGVKLIQAASWENPYHSFYDPAVRQAAREKMDPQRFQMIYGGDWGRMHGLVYDCWEDDRNIISPFELPTGTRYFGGIDWGYTDPFVFKVRAITPDGMEYGISEFYKTRLTFPDQMKVVMRTMQIWPIEKIYCGTDQPGHIEEFNRQKIPAEGADTNKGSIRRGIDMMYELIKTGKYKEFSGACPYSLDERSAYHYPHPDDLGPDDDTEDQNPVAANDHAMDVDRYITLSTRHLIKQEVIRAPKSTNPFDEIFKKKRRGGAEKWSQ